MIDNLVHYSPQIIFWLGVGFLVIIMGFIVGLLIKIVRKVVSDE